jgi:death-on-curing protein
LRDLGALESAVAQPRMTFGGQELYPTLVDKAAALAYSLVLSHPFVDGNKRIGHAAMEVFLLLNGFEIVAAISDQEALFLGLAGGSIDRGQFIEWMNSHTAERSP